MTWIKDRNINTLAFFRPRFGVIESFDIHKFETKKLKNTLEVFKSELVRIRDMRN